MDLPASALVLGLARSGQAAALALARRGVHVVGADRSTRIDTGRLAQAGVEIQLGNEETRLLDAVELVVKSPGVPGEAPLVAGARQRGLPVWSEVELGYRLLDAPIVGVTGTNGKTTTAELLGAIFRAAGRDVEVAGNVGRALCELDGDVAASTWVVCELSSFQLEDIERFRARVAVLLNLEPDHLDRHASVDAYEAAKLRVFENQRTEDVAVVPRGFREVPGEGRRVEFDPSQPLPDEPLLPGAHNRENAAAATEAARAAGVTDEAIAAALRTFAGVEHRLELVAEIDGVRYVNDSKATNTAAARRALASYEAPLLLILGGRGKGEDLDAFVETLPANVRVALLIGETADELARACERTGREYVRAGELGAAVLEAAKRARAGEVVLLTPACASYDQFENFEERGDAFKRHVEGLR